VNPARHRSRSGEAGGPGNSSDCKERAREIKEFLISEYAIIFTN
jgi:hypothetical protein